MEGRAENTEQFMSCIYDCHFLQLLCCRDAKEDRFFLGKNYRERELGFGNIAFTVVIMHF